MVGYLVLFGSSLYRLEISSKRKKHLCLIPLSIFAYFKTTTFHKLFFFFLFISALFLGGGIVYVEQLKSSDTCFDFIKNGVTLEREVLFSERCSLVANGNLTGKIIYRYYTIEM